MIDKSTESELNSILDDKKDVVRLRGRKKSIGWIRNATLRKMTDIQVDKRENAKIESQIPSKLAACIVLNDFFKLKFFYAITWRWYYYIRQYSNEELLPIIEMGKKKVMVTPYYSIMILAQDTKDTHQTMTRSEVERTLQELRLASKE